MSARSVLAVAVIAYFAIAALGATNQLQGDARGDGEQQCHDRAGTIGVDVEAADESKTQGGAGVHAVKAASRHARAA